jgi:hypothetical protein
MEHLNTVRLELGINAQRFMQQVMVNNQNMEDQIQAGIQMALDEISNTENFALIVKDKTIAAISSLVTEATFGWEVRKKIQKAIDDQIQQKINEFAEKIASNILKGMNIQDIKIEP